MSKIQPITRRGFLKAAGAVTAGLSLGRPGAAAPEEKPMKAGARENARPNILWICTDQQRFDTVAALGNPHIRTPHLDQLVSEGMAFTHAFSQSPVCTPSRASFLTGRYPRTAGPRRNGQALPPSEALVTKTLADAGYDCGLSGKLHIAPCMGRVEPRMDDGYRVFHWSHDPTPQWPENEYHQWLAAQGVRWRDIYRPDGRPAYPGAPSEYHQTTWCADRAIDFVREKRDAPWLMSVNIYDPHHPFDPPKEYLDRYDPDALPDPAYVPGELDNKPPFQKPRHNNSFRDLTARERRECTAAYYAMIEHADHHVGRMLKALDETGQRDNTIVIFMSDHGELLGDHGMYLKGPYLYDCSVRVPLIVRWPGRFPAGKRSDALVELVDLAPTLLEAAGRPVPSRMQGKSLMGILSGASDVARHKDEVYTEFYEDEPFSPRVKDRPMLTMLRTSAAKVVVYAGLGIGELYDLEADPGEHVNLWDDPAHARLKAEMIKRCFDASVLRQDPLPPVEAPW